MGSLDIRCQGREQEEVDGRAGTSRRTIPVPTILFICLRGGLRVVTESIRYAK